MFNQREVLRTKERQDPCVEVLATKYQLAQWDVAAKALTCIIKVKKKVDFHSELIMDQLC